MLCMVLTIAISSCKKSPDDGNMDVEPVKNLSVLPYGEEKGIRIVWTNPKSSKVQTIEVAYQIKGADNRSTDPSSNPTLITNFTRGGSSTLKLTVPTYDTYVITVTSIDNNGNRSKGTSTDAQPYRTNLTLLLEQADMMMSNMVDLMLGGTRDLWSNYPRKTDEGESLWGQGAGFSAFTALRVAAQGTAREKKYGNMEDMIFNGLENYLYTIDGIRAYTVYPSIGNDRYYDDNVWIGLDMIDLFLVTGNQRYLNRAKTVWEYLLKGTDDVAGGGIHWRERPATQSKHACSTGPGIVMACKLYNITGEEHYLTSAKKLYNWMISTLQDPSDFLVWDNARDDSSAPGGIKVEKNKYSYNSGQLLQAAVLLYEITSEQVYLHNARNIAASCFAKWFVPYYSNSLQREVTILKGKDNMLWMLAVMARGFFELYKADPAPYSKTYINAIENTASVVWDSRNIQNNFVANNLTSPQSGGSINLMDTAAVVEIFGRMAKCKFDGQQ